MAKKDYDKTLFRLLDILTKLSEGEAPNVKELAEMYDVSPRTIQKDFKEKLNAFSIERGDDFRFRFTDGFSLRRTFLDTDELMILNLALSQFNDVKDIDKIKTRIFKKLANKKILNPYFIKQDDIVDIDIESPRIEHLEKLIQNQEIVRLAINNTTVDVELYKITNYDGFWYLFAKDIDDNMTKMYKLHRIKRVIPLGEYHRVKAEDIEHTLSKINSAFYADGTSFNVLIKVNEEVAEYFKQKDYLDSQKIVKENKDGSLEVSFEVSHDEDIDNIIKGWIPHVEVLEPVRFREKMLNELKEYVGRLETN